MGFGNDTNNSRGLLFSLISVLLTVCVLVTLWQQKEVAPTAPITRQLVLKDRREEAVISKELSSLTSHLQGLSEQLRALDKLGGLEEKLKGLEQLQADVKAKMQGLEGQLANSATARASDQPSGPKPADECDVFRNQYTDAFQSNITRRLDWKFLCLALKAGTDKVTRHSYQYIYSKYLAHVRNDPIKMLEIGLGCSMHYGPGKSLQVWTKLFPAGQVSFLEYDMNCANKFRDEIEAAAGGKLYGGDQADAALQAQVVKDAKESSLYDMIVDDGGHNPTVQMKTLLGLWPALKRGGIFVMEDVQPTYFKEEKGSPYVRLDSGATFMEWASNMTHALNCGSKDAALYRPDFKEKCSALSAMEKEVLAVDCMAEACVVVKR